MRRLCLIALVLSLSACHQDGYTRAQNAYLHSIGNAARGGALIQHYGCGGCHDIDGVPNADGIVGPPLNNISQRIYIAGLLRNSPDNLELFIKHPQWVVKGNAMPEMGINDRDAKDIAAYLYRHE